MARRKQAEQPQEQGGRKRTQPTEPPTSGGRYDARDGSCLEAPPEEHAAERDETRKE